MIWAYPSISSSYVKLKPPSSTMCCFICRSVTLPLPYSVYFAAMKLRTMGGAFFANASLTFKFDVAASGGDLIGKKKDNMMTATKTTQPMIKAVLCGHGLFL